MTSHRRVAVPLLLVTLAAAVLAACAGGDGGVAAGPSVDPTGVVSSGPLPPPGSPPTVEPANELTPEPAVDLRRQRWQSAEPAPDDPSAVVVRGTLDGGPPCVVLGKVEVDETANRVTVTVWVGRRADAPCDGPQAQVAFPFTTRVPLKGALGGREVHDGAV